MYYHGYEMPKIYQEIKQTKPYRVPAQLAIVTIIRTSDVLRHSMERTLSPYNLSDEQYNILRILRGAGGSGLPTLEIASRMISRSPNITRLLDRLIAKKLVRRSRSTEDRRVVNVSIAPQGLELLAHLDDVIDQWIGRFPSTTGAEMDALVGVLDRVRDRMSVMTATERSAGVPKPPRR
jgi:DNA-binding MarR family transcriptional regulator